MTAVAVTATATTATAVQVMDTLATDVRHERKSARADVVPSATPLGCQMKRVVVPCSAESAPVVLPRPIPVLRMCS